MCTCVLVLGRGLQKEKRTGARDKNSDRTCISRRETVSVLSKTPPAPRGQKKCLFMTAVLNKVTPPSPLSRPGMY